MSFGENNEGNLNWFETNEIGKAAGISNFFRRNREESMEFGALNNLACWRGFLLMQETLIHVYFFPKQVTVLYLEALKLQGTL